MNKIDVPARITPQMAAVLAKQDELAGDAFATDVGLDQMRDNYTLERRFWNEGGPAMAKTCDDTVAGPYGAIPVRYHYPVIEAGALPGIVYIHGGGFVVGNLDTHDRIMRCLAALSGAAVVGVDYRLSPEAKFPSAIEECAAVVAHLRAAGADRGIDPETLVLAGDSGGAMLCLATNLYLRDGASGNACIKALLLYYGMFGLRDSRTQRLFGGSWDGLTQEDLAYYMECYCRDVEADARNPLVNTLGADLGFGIPPAYVAAAGLDPLLDDSLTLAAMLEGCGSVHELEIFDGVLHAFLHHSRMLDEARTALEHGVAFMRKHLGFSGETIDFTW